MPSFHILFTLNHFDAVLRFAGWFTCQGQFGSVVRKYFAQLALNKRLSEWRSPSLLWLHPITHCILQPDSVKVVGIGHWTIYFELIQIRLDHVATCCQLF